MLTRRTFITITLSGALAACVTPPPPPDAKELSRRARLKRLSAKTPQPAPTSSAIPPREARLVLTDAQWRERLTPRQHEILREGGTELAWTGRYLKNRKPGRYHCAACNNPLFDSDHKYDSRTGWPSFTRPTHRERILTRPDLRHELERTEVACAHCDSHLGHVFNDGPKPLGLRYCVNSIALYFRPS